MAIGRRLLLQWHRRYRDGSQADMTQRRRFLQNTAGLLAATALPAGTRAAVGDATGSTAPRIALVIGNAQYRTGPLLNPANDASAIAKNLAELGFECQLLLDAKLQDMSAAVQRYGELLTKQKAVGLFYYAGHGAQLAWRNYLVPVDANLRTLEDLPRQTLELNTLLQVLRQAANPMNVIILDACRDNPFGSGLPLEQKGLSQFDAPNGSLLSYATAPGNTASDGEGANGLFTENLLREMRVSGAKLEDVFKRVRLKVRLKSKGQQIPWESTSLEDDFYFVRSAEELAKISEERKAALFAEEMALWNSTKDATTPAVFGEYLARYPNGKFSQLAQVQLDRLLKKQGEKKVELASSANNPFTQGTSSAVGKYAVGDSFSFEVRDGLTNILERSGTQHVTEIGEQQIVFNDGALILDLVGNEIKSSNPRFLSPAQLYPAEYTVGAKWSTQFGWRRDNGAAGVMELDFKVQARQKYVSPVGTFNAFKVSGAGWVIGGNRWTMDYWIAPEFCTRPLQFEAVNRDRRGIAGFQRTTLVAVSRAAAQSS